MKNESAADTGEATLALLLVLGVLLPPGLWLWIDTGRPWWLIYVAWLGCIIVVALAQWRRGR